MTGMCGTEITEPFRQVTPGNSSTEAVQHRFNKQAVILGRDAYVSLTSRK